MLGSPYNTHLSVWQKQAPVAQLDRASVYGTEGLGFESLQAYFPIKLVHAPINAFFGIIKRVFIFGVQPQIGLVIVRQKFVLQAREPSCYEQIGNALQQPLPRRNNLNAIER